MLISTLRRIAWIKWLPPMARPSPSPEICQDSKIRISHLGSRSNGVHVREWCACHTYSCNKANAKNIRIPEITAISGEVLPVRPKPCRKIQERVAAARTPARLSGFVICCRIFCFTHCYSSRIFIDESLKSWLKTSTSSFTTNGWPLPDWTDAGNTFHFHAEIACQLSHILPGHHDGLVFFVILRLYFSATDWWHGNVPVPLSFPWRSTDPWQNASARGTSKPTISKSASGLPSTVSGGNESAIFLPFRHATSSSGNGFRFRRNGSGFCSFQSSDTVHKARSTRCSPVTHARLRVTLERCPRISHFRLHVRRTDGRISIQIGQTPCSKNRWQYRHRSTKRPESCVPEQSCRPDKPHQNSRSVKKGHHGHRTFSITSNSTWSKSVCSDLVGSPVEGPPRCTSTITSGSSVITARFMASLFKQYPVRKWSLQPMRRQTKLHSRS